MPIVIAKPNLPVTYSSIILGTTSATIEGYWTMDAEFGLTVSDSSTNGRDLTRNASTTSSSGKVNEAVDYNKLIGVDSSGSYSFSTGYFDDFSIEAWVYTREDPPVAKPILSVRNGASVIFAMELTYGTNYPSGPSSLIIHVGGGTSVALNSVPLNGWHHVVVTQERAVGRNLYVDGSNVLNVPGSSPQIPASDNIISGSYPSSYSLDGLIDELVLYSGILSPSDILAHYNAA